MATKAVDELFDWFSRLASSKEDSKNKLKELEEEQKIISKQIAQLEEEVEHETNVASVVANAINSTPLEEVIIHAKSKGFSPIYDPKKMSDDEFAEVCKTGGLSCWIYFKRPASFDNEITEKMMDYALKCLKTGFSICVLGKEERIKFYKWMNPLRCVLYGSKVRCKDEEGKEQEYDLKNDLDEEFLNTMQRLKDNDKELYNEARKKVIATMKCREGFDINFYLEKDGSIKKEYTTKNMEDGVLVTVPYGWIEQIHESVPILKEGEKESAMRNSKFVPGKPPELCQNLNSLIDEYDGTLKVAHEKKGYMFALDHNVEIVLKNFNPSTRY